MSSVINSESNPLLREQIRLNLGNCVQFTNGCWLDLVEDEGKFWGECPYSNVWGCKVDDAYIDTIIDWLQFWNEARTEEGEKVKRVV